MPRSSFSSDEAYYRAAYNAIAQNSCALAQPGSNGARKRSAPSNPGLCNQLLQYASKSTGRKAGCVAYVMAVSKVSAIARPIPTVASFSMYVPFWLLPDFIGDKIGGECELLHTSLSSLLRPGAADICATARCAKGSTSTDGREHDADCFGRNA